VGAQAYFRSDCQPLEGNALMALVADTKASIAFKFQDLFQPVQAGFRILQTGIKNGFVINGIHSGNTSDGIVGRET